MKISDKERQKKIIKTWDSLQKQMEEHRITRDVLLKTSFSMGGYYAALQYRWNRSICSALILRKSIPIFLGAWFPACVIGWFTIMKVSTGRLS